MEVTSFTERGKVNTTQKSTEITRVEGCLQGFGLPLEPSTLMNWRITRSITKMINHRLLRVDIFHMNKRASTSTICVGRLSSGAWYICVAEVRSDPLIAIDSNKLPSSV